MKTIEKVWGFGLNSNGSVTVSVERGVKTLGSTK